MSSAFFKIPVFSTLNVLHIIKEDDVSGIRSVLGAMKSVYRILIGYLKRRDHWEDAGCEHSGDAATLLLGLGLTPRLTCLRKCWLCQDPEPRNPGLEWFGSEAVLRKECHQGAPQFGCFKPLTERAVCTQVTASVTNASVSSLDAR